MTLYRQLLLYAGLTLLALAVGLWAAEIHLTRKTLTSQLASQNQDTATFLGLSLSTLTDGQDVAAMESMVNALFDRGYYLSIQVRDIHGGLLVDRTAEVQVEGVPDWFVRLTRLDAPQAQAMLMRGWQQAGTIIVIGHPGFAYQALWTSTINVALWLLATMGLVALVGGLALRRLLLPLRAIEDQAIALCERRFPRLDIMPRTRELRQVVMAMNQMTEQIRGLFEEQTLIADRLRKWAYEDPVTGIGNRRFLESQIGTKMSRREAAVRGVLVLFQVQDLQALNQNDGYQAGDDLLKGLAQSLRQTTASLPDAIVGRLGGGDFVLLLPDSDAATATAIADQVVEAVSATEASAPRLLRGAALYEQATSFTDLLATADTALNEARYRQAGRLVVLTQDRQEPAIGRLAWKERIQTILQNRELIFYAQPIVAREDRSRLIHHELLTRVPDPSGVPFSIGQCVPAAVRFNLMPKLDKLIIEQLMQLPLSQLGPQGIAINLSPHSLGDPDFTEWIYPRLQQCADAGIRFYFEVSEYRLARSLAVIREFVDTIRPMGHGLGIDHFGQEPVPFGYLQSLLPDYVKIDRALTNELHDPYGDTAFLVTALCNVAHSLGIRVVAEGIETEVQWKALAKMPVDAVQGYFIQRPEQVIWTTGKS
ncbi:MAG: bifunctional diguanylate cyclase/phosphodiesterase [Desulfobulbus sp.]|jgi:diguanylate cyclase (GGDEF)-like protein